VRFSFRSLIGLGLTVAAFPLASMGSGLVAEPGAPVEVAPALITPVWVSDPAIATDQTLLSDENVTFSANPAKGDQPKMDMAKLDPELECMAKVVRHEAANQSRKGQRAVAEIIMNRVRSGRFAETVCGVANQPGQFFETAKYNPRRDTAQWQLAVEVSREVMAGQGENVAEGAYFYHAAYQAPTRFFRGRQQVLAMGDHIFYR
jgi:spore germination cell wall hydrolase CwlJ-like protein